MSDRDRACLGCGSNLPGAFLDLGETPLANAYLQPEQLYLPEATFPLAVAYCHSCNLVQLTHVVPPEKMFSDYLYFTSYSDTFLAHARKMAESLAERFHLGVNTRVLEIGSNDGYLLQYFQQRGIPVLGVEPAKNVAAEAEHRGIPMLNRFFGLEAVEEITGGFGPSDLIIGNNVLAHVPMIGDFLNAVKKCLKPTAVAVFEFPYLKELIDKTEFDTIYHEHVFYFSLWAVKNLAERAGLQVFDVSHQSVHGGSLRVFLAQRGVQPVGSNVEIILEEEKATGLTRPERYASFSRDVAVLKQELLRVLQGLKASGKRLAAYGAPAKGNTLLNCCGIGLDLLTFTVDRSPHKQGLYLPGSHIPIYPPGRIRETKPDYLFILPWNLRDEIREQMAYVREWGGQFVVPIPQVAVLP